jgi:hypothetical protein
VEFPGHDGCSAGAEALEGRAVTLFSAQDDDVDTKKQKTDEDD